MKTHKILIPILTGVLFAAAANAQEDITITGSTAARRIVYDRAATLFDPGFTTFGGALSFANSANTITASGTMSNAIPSLGSTPVTLRFSMSGSVQGLSDLNLSHTLTTLDPGTGVSTNNGIPCLLAFADNFPEAATPPISSSQFTANTNLMALPFVFIKNLVSDMTGVTSLTREQAIMLMTSSGTVGGFPAMKPDFLGGTTNNGPIYLLGRDIGSGTRVGTVKDIGFTGTPRQWTTNGSGGMVLASSEAGVAGSGVVAIDVAGNVANGFSSGGTLCKVLAGLPGTINAIGYAGEPDASSGNGVTTNNWLSYEGVPCTHANVANGTYPVWCYEHIYGRNGGLSANQQLVYNAFVAALTEPNYQNTNVVFTANAVPLNQMKVKRGVDGGSFTTTPAAGF